MALDRTKVKGRLVEVGVLLDCTLLDEHARLEAELARAVIADVGENKPPTAPAIAAAVADLETRIEAEETSFSFRGIGTSRWYGLNLEHPATPEQRKLGLDNDWRTFRPALLAESCVEPGLTVDDAAFLMDTLPARQWAKLWMACNEANEGSDGRPKSRLAVTVRELNGHSATPPIEGSLAEPSSAAPVEPSPTTSTTPPDD